MQGSSMDGGQLVAEVLLKQGVKFLFTLCGGHISPILVGCEERDIRVIDVRHEVNAVFAADAVSRLTGISGVATVTAGPGVTNTITAVKNAQLAQSPLIILGGATPTLLRGKGSLQDIDQLELMKPHVKWAVSVKKVCDIVPTLEKGFKLSYSGVPGPVFIEIPADILYPEPIVRDWYAQSTHKKKSFKTLVQKAYLGYHLHRQFAQSQINTPSRPISLEPLLAPPKLMDKALDYIESCKQPVLLVGSQAMLSTDLVNDLKEAVGTLDMPVFLTGMARGLLGRDHALQLIHGRKNALKNADLVLLAGVPLDFRLDYGRQINPRAIVISVNRCEKTLKLNKRPTLPVLADSALFIKNLAKQWQYRPEKNTWYELLKEADNQGKETVEEHSLKETENLNPVQLCRTVDEHLDENSIIIADGGDFVGTAAYTVSPHQPLSWLDPGSFGTLGAGAGFAIGAKLCRPESEIWLLYGDGSLGFSIAEFDTFVRHQLGIVAVVGNDAAWSQIARDQIDFLKSNVATQLNPTDYHLVVKGFGAEGVQVKQASQVGRVLKRAKLSAENGTPILINAMIGDTGYRKGSLSF